MGVEPSHPDKDRVQYPVKLFEVLIATSGLIKKNKN